MESQYPRETAQPGFQRRLAIIWRKTRYRLLRLFVRSRRKYRTFDETKGREWRRKAGDATHSASEKAASGIDELIVDTRQTYHRYRPKADSEAKKLKKTAKRRYKIARVKAGLIGTATLLWTRRILATLYLAVVIGAIAFVVWWLSQEEEPALDLQTTLQCQDCEPLTVSRIIDGDTIDVNGGQTRIRIYGADTPERGEECFIEATDAMRQLAGSTVRVEPGPRASDPNDRDLYYLYTESGNSIDEMLIRNGLAEAWTRDGQHKELLTSLQLQASGSDTGCLWS